MNKGLIYTNDKCIGCNKCVRICSSFGASISHTRPNHNSIEINSERCINCGACIDVCQRGAREYLDDTNKFFNDLKNKEEISALVAPAFIAKYPNKYKSILGALRKLGIKKIIPVSLGADICTWAYLKLINEKGYTEKISTACPVVVSYIEHWMPSLIDKLMPVKSPLMCLATYLRNVLGYKEKFAFIGPCIAKKSEMEEFPELVEYNITFPKLIEYVDKYNYHDEKSFDKFDYGLGSFYPAPGGLADNLKWFLGDDTPVRVISGKTYLYQYLSKLKDNIEDDELSYTLFDALNCQEGCLEVTAKSYSLDIEDKSILEINEIRANSKHTENNSPWNPNICFEDRLKNLNGQFKNLNLDDYLIKFIDRSDKCKVLLPNEAEANKIYLSMHKDTDESRHIDCSACGYESCEEMMIAIHNGFNTKHNCVYSEKEESIYLTKMSFADQLTGVMNRNAYERKIEALYANNKPLAFILADVNGLKLANDTGGHAAGDRLIIETAKGFANEFGVENVYRIGGDEFLTILEDYKEKEIIENIELVKKYLASIDVSASIGYSYNKSFNGNINELLEIADKKMYEDKDLYYKMTGKERRK